MNSDRFAAKGTLPIKHETKILLFDCHELESTLIAEILVNIGCIVTSVFDVNSCICQFADGKYDLVILDQATSGTDIHNLVSKFEEIDPFTPIAMMTSTSVDLYAEGFAQSNIDFLVPKPFGRLQLFRLIEEAVVFSQRLQRRNRTDVNK
ncbi:MAG: response regulator [Deltaproteobacteria bacterium]|nr:MAG: response regulator [Deltaproteobacteria bacterium]